MQFRNLFLALGLLAIPACATTRSAKNIPAGESTAHFNRVITKKASLDYLVYMPPDAAATPGKPWPAIIFLHGSGERGTNAWDVAKHGPPKIVKDKKDFPFI
ncbi:MAG TPA: phospholipase, partial [Verrucomicrobiae bacterium]|nr:phospholipase [Verrucomicrobiae bacterium]